MNRKYLKILLSIAIVITILLIGYKVYFKNTENQVTYSNLDTVNRLEENSTSGDYSFSVVGEVNSSIRIFSKQIAPLINENEDIKFVVSVGDFVDKGEEDRYEIAHNMINDISTEVLLTVGENEISEEIDWYYTNFGPLYYSFIYNNDLFVFLDSTSTSSLNRQLDYLDSQLNLNDYNNSFVFINDDLKDSDPNFYNELIDILQKNDVNALFTNNPGYYENETVGNLEIYRTGGGGGKRKITDSESYNHFLNVNVNEDGSTVEVVEVSGSSSGFLMQLIYRIYIRFQAIFYSNQFNILLSFFIFTILLLSYILYVTKPKNYYQEFTNGEIKLVKDKLNIAMFTNNYYPFIGGVPISIDRLATELINQGHKVTIYAPDYPDNNVTDPDYIYRVKLLKKLKTKKFDFIIANIFLKSTKRHFEESNYDIVHVHHPFWMGKLGLRLANKNKIPVVLTYHTRFEKYSHNLPVFRTSYENIFSHKILYNFAQDTQGIITPTKAALNYLENIGVSRTKIILPTGVDIDKYKNLELNKVSKLREQLNLNDEITLCSVSRLTEEKNIMFMLHSILNIKNLTTKKFKLIIMGDGPLKEEIEEFILKNNLSNNVILLGNIDRNEITYYYKMSDIFVFSSLSETQGMVLLEAMAGYCPVVAINSSGISDTIIDGYNGFKTSESIVDWSSNVVKLIDNKDLREKLAENSYEYATEYSTQNTATKMNEFYKQVIEMNYNMKDKK